MPIYEFYCEKCQIKHIESRGITEEQKLTNCPDCDTLLKRVFSTPTITFNGSGFYATDKKK